MGSSAPWSKGFATTAVFSFYYPRCERKEYQCSCSHKKHIQASSYHERAAKHHHEIAQV
jgi:hypothetical protein